MTCGWCWRAPRCPNRVWANARWAAPHGWGARPGRMPMTTRCAAFPPRRRPCHDPAADPETAPHPQARTEFRLADGQVTIGRGDDCDWQIDDPQMFVSRRHCVIVGAGGQYRITDESRGGVFVDSATAPLGTGVTAPLQAGMRLAFGRFRDPRRGRGGGSGRRARRRKARHLWR